MTVHLARVVGLDFGEVEELRALQLVGAKAGAEVEWSLAPRRRRLQLQLVDVEAEVGGRELEPTPVLTHLQRQVLDVERPLVVERRGAR